MSRAVAAVVAALLACGPGEPPPSPREPDPEPTNDEPQPLPEDTQPPQAQPGQPGAPPQQACDPAGDWSISFERTGSDGGYCAQPELASATWTIRIRDVEGTRFSYDGTNARGSPIGGTAALDASTCEAAIGTLFEGVLVTEPDGTPVSGRISSEHRMTFGASTVEGEGRETFTSDAPHPSFPCTVTWRVRGTR